MRADLCSRINRAADHKLLERELLASFNTNVIGNVNLFNLVIPLVLKGNAKKVIAISSGVADDVLTAKYDLESSAPYAISKAGLNTAVAKFSAQYRKDGVLFLSISPGVVDTFDTSQRKFPPTRYRANTYDAVSDVVQ